MTRAISDRVLKDANFDVGGHLKNHIHLTNCVHLKNHMHKHSPMLAERSLARDLVFLQRSRSLRDPSASPPSLTRLASKREKDFPIANGRQENAHTKNLFEHLNDVRMESDDVAASHFHIEQAGVKRGRRRKFRPNRRRHNEMEVVAKEEKNEKNEMNGPKKGCGIPLNWSRIHHRSKSFLDMAGRSLYCGLSDTKPKRSDVSATSHSSLFSKFEETPILVEGLESQDSTKDAAWKHGYSGELGVYADNLLNQVSDSDFASEIRSGVQNYFKRNRNNRPQNLTQKYMPEIFGDIVGQNLVTQALSNAIVKRKIGSLYVFYGPHGTGKTSSARIFARALNCHSIENPKPCGLCKSCATYDLGKSRNIREISSVSSNKEFERMMELLDNTTLIHAASQYRVFIVDDCDNLSGDYWNVISKVINRAPRGVVFVFVSSSLEVLPHMILSRCQKFFFPKLKDADIVYTLQRIAAKEELDIDKDALKLIVSRSDGSLRDAEMTLEQLSLLGEEISVSLVQELVGLISEEKLVYLLDLALSADTINTVKNLREIMESGVEPLDLMSQLATVVTDILAGTYDLSKERPKGKFFRKQFLSRKDMEKLRQALRTLSEAEKQLRNSNDKVTWLTAALLQLAPDQQYLLPDSSANTSFMNSPLFTDTRNVKKHEKMSESADTKKASDRSSFGVEDVWQAVLDNILTDSIKQFMYQEGKLISINYGAAPTVQLKFSSHLAKSRAEMFEKYLLQAFESVLGSPVAIEIRCETNTKQSEIVEIFSRKDVKREEYSCTKHKTKDNRSTSLVRRKLSLAQVIQQAERVGWSRIKAISISEKLEQQNLKLEPRSRSLLCWKRCRKTRLKLSHLKRTRKPQVLLKFMSCGKCISSNSPR